MKLELAGSAGFLSTINPATALFIVWGGANDFLATGGSPAAAAANIDGIVASLLADGAQHILVPGMPDLGLTPDFYGDPTATAFAATFNTLLQATLPTGATYVDTFNLLQSINKNPGAYGFTDATDPCLNTTLGTVCSDPSKYLFWDGFHPTTAADALLAKDFISAAEAPEPASILLMGSGISGLALMVRTRRRR
jgi:phospholipase/lecithinase/hemolysin